MRDILVTVSLNVTISQIFYAELLGLQIPKAQKDTDDVIVFFELLGSGCVKAASVSQNRNSY
jgi:hypothetical protein